MLQEETINSFVEKVASHLQCQEEAVLEWKAYVEHWLQLRVVKTTSSQREKKERAQKATAVKEKNAYKNLRSWPWRWRRRRKRNSKKTTVLANKNGSRLRNSEDPADKRKKNQLQEDRERKRKAYATKKNELQELKHHHTDIEEGRNTLLKELSVRDAAYVGHLVAKLRLKGEDARRKLKIAFPDLETLDIFDTEPAAEDIAGEAEAGQEEEKPDKPWVAPVVPKGPKKKRPVQKLPVEEEEEPQPQKRNCKNLHCFDDHTHPTSVWAVTRGTRKISWTRRRPKTWRKSRPSQLRWPAVWLRLGRTSARPQRHAAAQIRFQDAAAEDADERVAVPTGHAAASNFNSLHFTTLCFTSPRYRHRT